MEATEKNTWTSDLSGEVYSNDIQQRTTYCGQVATLAELQDTNYDFRYSEREGEWYFYEDCSYCGDIDDYVHIDDAVWVESMDEYVLAENAAYCDDCDSWYYDRAHSSCPNEYCPSNESHGGNEGIHPWHESDSPDDLNDGVSVFSIGFEVEKVHFINDEGNEVSSVGDYVGACEIFKGYETDSSCGVEAITHILPLVSKRHKYRNKFIEMLDEAKHVIEDSPASPSCGGHITLSCNLPEFNEGKELAAKLRFNMAIFYALFRGRLSNHYCRENKLMKYDYNTKFSPVKIMRNRIEIRLPNAVGSRKQLLNRYDLCFKLMQYSILKPCSWDAFKNHIKPNLNVMYRDNKERVKHVLNYADLFRDYLITEQANPIIEEFIN